MENPGKQTGTTKINVTNRIEEMEEKISSTQHMNVDKIDLCVNEKVKSKKKKKSLTHNIQEIWGNYGKKKKHTHTYTKNPNLNSQTIYLMKS